MKKDPERNTQQQIHDLTFGDTFGNILNNWGKNKVPNGPDLDRRAHAQLENELWFNERSHESRPPLTHYSRTADELYDIQRSDSALSVLSNMSDFSTGSEVEKSWFTGTSESGATMLITTTRNVATWTTSSSQCNVKMSQNPCPQDPQPPGESKAVLSPQDILQKEIELESQNTGHDAKQWCITLSKSSTVFINIWMG